MPDLLRILLLLHHLYVKLVFCSWQGSGISMTFISLLFSPRHRTKEGIAQGAVLMLLKLLNLLADRIIALFSEICDNGCV